MEHQCARIPVHAQFQHLAQDQQVVASVDALVDAAIDPGGDVVEQRRTRGRGRMPVDSLELIAAGLGEAMGQVLLAVCQDVGAERAGRLDRGPARRASWRGETTTSGGSSETDMNDPQTSALDAPASPR